CHQYYTTPRSF
nr:immunoglobulin light chain junction region [Macaca mulatta]